MKKCKEIAALWGVSTRTVNDLCKKGKISGAEKKGNAWYLPDDAVKPEDKRITTGEYKNWRKKSEKE